MELEKQLAKDAMDSISNRMDRFEVGNFQMLIFVLVMFELRTTGIADKWECYDDEDISFLTTECMKYWKDHPNENLHTVVHRFSNSKLKHGN